MREDLSGQKFGHLTVVSFESLTERGQSIWKCKCSCGNFKNIRGYHLKLAKIRSCGCLTRQNANIKHQSFKGIPRWLWNSARVSAKGRQIDFLLSAEDMWKCATAQNMKCALTGELLKFISDPKLRKTSNASLDRIDSSKGYILGNIQWVLKEANIAKNSLSEKDFIDLCSKVVKFRGNFNFAL